MYCSIQEAWPEHKFIPRNVEHFREDQQTYPNIQSIPTSTSIPTSIPTSISNNQINKCNSIIDHIESCPYCQNYIRQRYYKNQILDFINMNPQLKETIMVFLIGIVILMILNLFIK
jgi:hypothetical protein